jgi:hypothetical protein
MDVVWRVCLGEMRGVRGHSLGERESTNCCRMHECVAVGSSRSSRSESSDDLLGCAHGRARKLACGFAVAGTMIIFIFFRIYAKNRKFPNFFVATVRKFAQ